MDAFGYTVMVMLQCSGINGNPIEESQTFPTLEEARKYEAKAVSAGCFKDPIRGKCCRVSEGIDTLGEDGFFHKIPPVVVAPAERKVRPKHKSKVKKEKILEVDKN